MAENSLRRVAVLGGIRTPFCRSNTLYADQTNLDLMTTAQHEALPAEEDVTAADRLIVESPTPVGLIVVRALIPEPALQPMANAAVSAAQCKGQS